MGKKRRRKDELSSPRSALESSDSDSAESVLTVSSKCKDAKDRDPKDKYAVYKVLQTFKKLHRTRMKVFAGDEKALIAGRLKINEEFHKNKHVTNEDAIKAMIKLAEDVEKELRTHVIQAREVKPGVFEAKITKDTAKFENIPYDDNAVLDDGTTVNRPCCQNEAQKNNIS